MIGPQSTFTPLGMISQQKLSNGTGKARRTRSKRQEVRGRRTINGVGASAPLMNLKALLRSRDKSTRHEGIRSYRPQSFGLQILNLLILNLCGLCGEECGKNGAIAKVLKR